MGHNPLAPLVERVELTLAASSADSRTFFANFGGFVDRAESIGATYEALVVMVIAERLGDANRNAEILRLMDELGIVALPMLADAWPDPYLSQ